MSEPSDMAQFVGIVVLVVVVLVAQWFVERWRSYIAEQNTCKAHIEWRTERPVATTRVTTPYDWQFDESLPTKGKQ